jgi:hypothetical protein
VSTAVPLIAVGTPGAATHRNAPGRDVGGRGNLANRRGHLDISTAPATSDHFVTVMFLRNIGDE